MDNSPANSIYRERQVFLAKLKTSPLFFLTHLPSLINIIWQRLHQKCHQFIRGTHLGNKKRPHWLKPIKNLGANSYHEFQESVNQLIWRQASTTPLLSENKKQMISINKIADHEDYLAKHRWGSLVEEIFTNSDADDFLRLSHLIQNRIAELPSQNDAAWETYSSCERVANLITWLTFLPKEKRARATTPEVFLFLQESINWIFQHLEFYGTETSNHILNNARALIMGGTVLKNNTAIQAGVRILQQMLPVLVQENGSLRERSTHYQLIVLHWLLDALTFAKESSIDDQQAIDFLQQTIKKMQRLASKYCDHDGNLQALIGDISPDTTPLNTVKRLIACYPNHWPMPPNQIYPSPSVDDWYFLNGGPHKIILNCPPGRHPKSHPSHAHGDALSFVWIHDGEEILIDCGRSRYTKDPISIQQKSALGHNLPLVDGLAPLCESFVISGNWWPLPYARANIQIVPSANAICIKHDGYKRATNVTSHQRKIEICGQGIQVTDTFLGNGRAEINLLWQLHPSFTELNIEKLYFKNDHQLIMVDLNQTFVPTKIAPFSRWYSSQYGSATPNPLLSLVWNVSLPFTTIIKFTAVSCAA